MTIETGRLAKQAAGAAVVTYGETVVLVTATTPSPARASTSSRSRSTSSRSPRRRARFPAASSSAKGASRTARCWSRASSTARSARSSRTATTTRRRSRRPCSRRTARTPPDIAAFVGASAALTISEIPVPRADRRGAHRAASTASSSSTRLRGADRAERSRADRRRQPRRDRDGRGRLRSRSPKPRCSRRSASPTASAAADRSAGRAAPPGRQAEARGAGAAPTRRRSRRASAAWRALGSNEALQIQDKKARYAAIDEAETDDRRGDRDASSGARRRLRQPRGVETRRSGLDTLGAQTQDILHDLRSELMRERVLDDGRAHRRSQHRRTSGRSPARCGSCRGPTASALFTRGETQALVSTTLGSAVDEQTIDALTERCEKRFMLHYNFPPFSVGEARPLRGPGRREVGHGTLAERAIAQRAAERRGLPVHDPRRLRDARVERLVVDGDGLRRDALADGRGRADQGAGRGHRDGPDRRTASASRSSRTSSATRTTSATWTSRSPAPATASPRCRWTSRSAASTGRSWSTRSSRRASVGCTSSTAWRRETRDVLGGASRHAPSSRATRRAWSTLRIKPDRIRDIIGPGGKVIRAIQETTGAKIDVEDYGEVHGLRAGRRRSSNALARWSRSSPRRRRSVASTSAR